MYWILLVTIRTWELVETKSHNVNNIHTLKIVTRHKQRV